MAAMASVALVSFNCAKQPQNAEQVSALVKSVILSASEIPDFFVFCLQEVAPIHDASLGWTEPYLAPFLASPPANYTLLNESTSGATTVIVFIRNGAPTPFKVETDQTSFGMFWSSLKGAALVSLHFAGSNNKQLTFVSAHFAAGENRKQQRNRDFQLLNEAFDLAKRPGQLIVAGDLNYRTRDGTLETDELTQELRSGTIAAGLSEGKITFEPTYKYEPGTDRLVSKRVPSFCDRVLYRAIPGSTDIIQKYDSANERLFSDHRPVYCILTTPIQGNAPFPTSHNTIYTSNTAKGNRVLVSNIADLVIGSGAFVVGTSTGRIGLTVALGFFIVYMLISR